MRVKEFRYLAVDEPFAAPEFPNWCRTHEWGYVLSVLKNVPDASVHNTSAGTWELHRQFHEALEDIAGEVVSTEIVWTDVNRTFVSGMYDILKPADRIYDVVLSISTLEHLEKREETVPLAYRNLLAQTKKRLIITWSEPSGVTEIFEGLLGQRCRDVEERLNGMNGLYKAPNTPYDSIGLLDIEVKS